MKALSDMVLANELWILGLTDANCRAKYKIIEILYLLNLINNSDYNYYTFILLT